MKVEFEIPDWLAKTIAIIFWCLFCFLFGVLLGEVAYHLYDLIIH